ncbi:MAG: sigma-70 family RNA polymerase sigma factor [Deltaproteobacteria bacterium]|nr:sigma-70 family RNA polymerase sigma factor [Deltaproteobacteria bacterium]MBW2138059.1 sigma-70 family RNA polymerase sigma factor [Deltaproteobacteria bacterium]
MTDQNPERADDLRLLAACISGDRGSWRVFVQRFSNLIYQTVRRTCASKHVSLINQDIEDLHNTVFLNLFEEKCKKLRQYRGKNGCSVASWIRLVTVRVVLNQVRKKGPDALAWKQRSLPLEEIPELRVDSPNPLLMMEAQERERIVKEAFRKLPSRDKIFVRLHFEEQLPIEEVAEALGVSTRTAYTVKHRAIKKLKTIVAANKG